MGDEPKQEDLAETAFRLHHDQIHRYLFRRTGSYCDAEELTQRVFVDAAAALSTSDPPDSLVGWLYAVADRRFIDHVRRRERRGEVGLNDRFASPPGRLEYGPAESRALAEAIARLPHDQREVVVLKLIEGRPFAEIGKQVGASEAACKMRFSRAIAALRADLEQQGLRP